MQKRRLSNGGGGDDEEAVLYRPRTAGQAAYLALLRAPEQTVVVCSGPAGTGKTLFACQEGMRHLLRGDVHRLILTRPAITANENHGFLPGTLENKMGPFMRPLFDAFEEIVGKDGVHRLQREGRIEICPFAYMRGRTFNHAWIVADEMQNATVEQTIMLLTRIGECTKMCLTGDGAQSDLALPGAQKNGLRDLLERLEQCASTPGDSLKHVSHVALRTCDVQRAPVVVEVLSKLYPLQRS